MQIYIPNARGCSVEPLRKLGLGELLEPGVTVSATDVLHNGPDGGAGVCFAWGEDVPGVHLDDQVWAPGKPNKQLERPAAAFWVGRAKGCPIIPRQIARPRQLPSLPVRLADGNDWNIPIAVRLPHKLGLDEQGEPIRTIETAYAAFYKRAEEYYNLLLGYRRHGAKEIPGGWQFGVDCLSLNYRINRDVADWLELFTEENTVWTIAAVLELPLLEEIAAQKKTAQPTV